MERRKHDLAIDRTIERSSDGSAGGPRARRLFLALEPPGNVSRDLCLYRRRLFGALAAPSALAFPECLVLAFAIGSVGLRRVSGPLRRDPAIGAAWTGIKEDFGPGRIFARGDSLFLRVEGPVPALAASAGVFFESLGASADPEPPFPPAEGFFLCGRLGARVDSAISAAEGEGPPELSFRDCSLVLMAWEGGTDPLSALRWRELGRAARWTGARPRGGRD
jgi:hypothetical protein